MISFDSMTNLEAADLLETITDPDLKLLLNAVMYEPGAWTRGCRRLNKSALCRILDCKPAVLEELFARLRNQFMATEDVPLFRFQVKEELTHEGRIYIPGEVIKVYAVTKRLKKLAQVGAVVQLDKSA